MAPSKRKAEDDFVLTISDNEDDNVPDLDAEILAKEDGAQKKRKRSDEMAQKKAKKQKKGKDGKAAAANGANNVPLGKAKGKAQVGEEEEEDDETGVWGAKDEDDGAMDSEFEFQLEADGDEALEDFEGWGLDGARKGLGPAGGDRGGNKKGVDIDEIIARRRAKKEGKTSKENADAEGSDSDEDGDEGADDAEEDAELELGDDSEDEFMAEDGFGMAVGSDVEEEGGDEDEDEDAEEDGEGQEDGSDDESVASEVPHPMDLAGDGSDDDEDDKEDPAEAAARKAFYAPEEDAPKDKKSTGPSSFQTMSLSRPILRGLAAVGFSQPTPIQNKTIPVTLLGKDVVGSAVTGSGKTAAFVVPILERLLYRPKKVPTSRVAILMPTRELAIQCHAVATKLASYTDIKFCLAVGGLSLKIQEAELRLRPDVIIATPGRFIDHMRNSPSFTVDTLEILVLDEADRMLEDGFADELNEILTTIPKSRQTMLFSATMTTSVDKLIRLGMNRPVRLQVDAQKQTVGTLVQEFVRLRPGREEKRMGYLLYLCSKVYTERVIVFFRQKKEAHRARIIFGLSGLKAAELHGSMSQEQVSMP